MIDVSNIENKKLLLIDDEESILNILETVLLKEGFKKIYKAATGYEGIEMCKSINPDMIVSQGTVLWFKLIGTVNNFFKYVKIINRPLLTY